MLGFFSSRRNWDSPAPSPTGECLPPPLWFRREGQTRFRERGWRGGSQFRREDRHCDTLGMYVLCVVGNRIRIPDSSFLYLLDPIFFSKHRTEQEKCENMNKNAYLSRSQHIIFRNSNPRVIQSHDTRLLL